MGAKTENKPQVMGTQLEPYSSSVEPHAFDVSQFYQQIAGMVKPGQACSCHHKLLCSHGARSVKLQMRLVKPRAVGTRLNKIKFLEL